MPGAAHVRLVRCRGLPAALALLCAVLATGNASGAAMHHSGARSPHHHPAAAAQAAGFVVGTPQRPTFMVGRSSLLGAGSRPAAPGGTYHGSFAAQTVAATLQARRAATTETTATQTRLSKRQATRKLSKRCRKLLRVKRPSKLSRTAKRKRSACRRQRDRLIRRSARGAQPAPEATGVPAPPLPSVAGPAPTAAPPGAATPTPTPDVGSAPGAQTNAERCADGDPATVCFAAAGVTAIDGDVPFTLTRGDVTADVVSFELVNTDRQAHNLWIAPASADGAEITGTPVEIFATLEPGGRAAREVTLRPGVYQLICTVPGHGPMATRFIVRAP